MYHIYSTHGSFDNTSLIIFWIQFHLYLFDSQIRLMVGAALVESLGLIPSFSIDFALAAPVQVVFPMAPAEGLVLVNAGISHTEKANHEYKIFSRFVRGYCGEFPLLTDEEYRISEEFKAKKVYPRMKLDWEKMAPFYPRNGIVSYEPELMVIKLIIFFCNFFIYFESPSLNFFLFL